MIVWKKGIQQQHNIQNYKKQFWGTKQHNQNKKIMAQEYERVDEDFQSSCFDGVKKSNLKKADRVVPK